tara:strand:+ start:4590 stop:4724 length:135 start_codon:yes stop_codon:yes gene_type:complete
MSRANFNKILELPDYFVPNVCAVGVVGYHVRHHQFGVADARLIR